ncbi:MAG: hypothetical protein ACT4PL_14240 [Phycisphaerales bacterium]
MDRRSLSCALSGAVGLCLLAGTAFAGPWTSGNLVVLQLGPSQNMGTGAPNLNSVAHAVSLREFTTLGLATGNDLAINSGASDTRLTMAGSATSEGQMNLSEDGQFLMFAGYDAAAGTSGPAAGSSIATSTTANVNRVVGRVDFSQNTSLFRISDTFSTNNFRSAASTNGTTFVGAASGAGLRNLDPMGGNTTTTVVTSNLLNNRVARYDLGGRLFVSASSGAFQGVSEVIAGVTTALPGFPTASGPSAYDFEFVSSTLLYVADDRTSAAGGLQRWELVSGSWMLQYTLAVTSGLRSIAVTQDGAGNNVIYGISGGTSAGGVTNLIAITDLGAGSTSSILATAASGNVFRSVEFVPSQIPTPGATGLVALAGLLAARRRR